MLRGNHPPQHPFFSFSFYLFSFTFQKKSENFGGGGLNPLNPPPLKYALGVLYSKSPIAHTAPLYIKMKQPKLSDLYTCNLLKLYHKLYCNRLPPYFDNFLPEFGVHNHMLRNDLIRLPVVRCEFGEMNAKYQMHLRLRNLTNPRNQQLPNIEITADTLGTSIHCFSKYLKTQFVRSYSNMCNLNDCFVCANSN